MQTGAITGYIDVAQVTLYAFWVFFALLIVYLRREDKREGYPLESERSPQARVVGWPGMPAPKTYLLRDGSTRVTPRAAPPAGPINAAPVDGWRGSPLEPTGNPLLAGVGPGSYAARPDTPDLTVEGVPKIVPLRAAPGYALARRDPDPRGMVVMGADRMIGGTVRDVWVDRSESLIRYFEVEVPAPNGTRRVLLPINYTRVVNRRVNVASLLGSQLADVPATQSPDQVTLREEDRITAYYSAGWLYATPSRMGPLL